MDGFNKAVYMLPPSLREAAEGFRGKPVEELRLRVGRRPAALFDGEEHDIANEKISSGDLSRVLERVTGASLHAAAPAMAEGYLSYMGLRIGFCGCAVIHNNVITGYKNFSSLSIRIPRQCHGICDDVIREIYSIGFANTLIISRPGGGKTTALREIIRRQSDEGLRVSVVDERNELSATDNGIAQFDLGRCSDTLVGVTKAEGAMMLLRGMNPQLIAMDEITKEKDIEAIAQVFGCGVGLLTSAHAAGKRELLQRPLYARLLEMKIFKYLITISGSGTRRCYYAERL